MVYKMQSYFGAPYMRACCNLQCSSDSEGISVLIQVLFRMYFIQLMALCVQLMDSQHSTATERQRIFISCMGQEMLVKLKSWVQREMRNDIFCTGKVAGLELKYECSGCQKKKTTKNKA